jgi:hypothetical protein
LVYGFGGDVKMAKKNFFKNDKEKGIFMMVVGAFIILFLFSVTTEKIIKFDGEQKNFSLRVMDWDSKAEAGDTMTLSLKVENIGDDDGSMYVQCSILDRNEHTWLQGLQSIVKLKENENCVENEPFTQTGIVTLAEGTMETVYFTMAIPDTPFGDNVIFCDAFEQCWAPGQDSMSSDKEIIQIDIVPNDGDNANNNFMRQGETCGNTLDCSGWALGKVKCVEGMCVDDDDIVETDMGEETQISIPKLDDPTIKDWAREHTIILWMFGFIGLIVGAMLAFKTPKRPTITRF